MSTGANNSTLPPVISIESLSEYKVNEISYNGVEIQEKPLNPSEHFKQLVRRIDFFKSTENIEEDDEEQVSEPPMEGVDPEKKPGRSKSATWPWRSVRAQVCTALEEVCALVDVLKMARDRKYLMLESVAAEPLSDSMRTSRQMCALVGKKRALHTAVAILNTGAERMRKVSSTTAVVEQSNFYASLVDLRKRWRLRKLGDTIIGDLSYRCVGSRYKESGTFEVRRVGGVLRLHLPAHLEGEAVLRVELGSSLTAAWQEELNSASVLLENRELVPQLESVNGRLQRAQTVLWINELFAILSNEAAQLATQFSVVTTGKKIFATLFSDVQLIISMERRRHVSESGNNGEYQPPSSSPLVLHLQEMLRDMHRHTCSEPVAHPVTAPAGVPASRMAAGPEGAHKSDLLEQFGESSSNEPLLMKFFRVAKHAWLQRLVAKTLEDMAQKSHDPLLLIHWSPLASRNKSQVKVDLFSPGYEFIHSGMLISVDCDNISIVIRDGRHLQLGTDIAHLRVVLQRQALHHHVVCVQQISIRPLSWHQTLPVCPASGNGPPKDLGAASHCLVLLSPDCRYTAVLHAGPTHGVRLLLGTTPSFNTDSQDELEQLLSLPDLTGTGLKQVDLDKIRGNSLASKIEGVLSCLTPLQPMNSPF